jgi:hypothetical protein
MLPYCRKSGQTANIQTETLLKIRGGGRSEGEGFLGKIIRERVRSRLARSIFSPGVGGDRSKACFSASGGHGPSERDGSATTPDGR